LRRSIAPSTRGKKNKQVLLKSGQRRGGGRDEKGGEEGNVLRNGNKRVGARGKQVQVKKSGTEEGVQKGARFPKAAARECREGKQKKKKKNIAEKREVRPYRSRGNQRLLVAGRVSVTYRAAISKRLGDRKKGLEKKGEKEEGKGDGVFQCLRQK